MAPPYGAAADGAAVRAAPGGGDGDGGGGAAAARDARDHAMHQAHYQQLHSTTRRRKCTRRITPRARAAQQASGALTPQVAAAIDRLAPLVAKLGAPFLAEQRAHHHGDVSFLYEELGADTPARLRLSSASPLSAALAAPPARRRAAARRRRRRRRARRRCRAQFEPRAAAGPTASTAAGASSTTLGGPAVVNGAGLVWVKPQSSPTPAATATAMPRRRARRRRRRRRPTAAGATNGRTLAGWTQLLTPDGGVLTRPRVV